MTKINGACLHSYFVPIFPLKYKPLSRYAPRSSVPSFLCSTIQLEFDLFPIFRVLGVVRHRIITQDSS